MKRNTIKLSCIYCKSTINKSNNFFQCLNCKKRFPIIENEIPIIIKPKNDFYNYNFKLKKFINKIADD